MIDPVHEALDIRPEHRVVTMGSCFAQHIARNLPRLGLNYHVVEVAPPGMSDQEANADGYNVFSARFGNVYTARQAVQLFDRAYGSFTPVEHVWRRGDGYVDSFRPRIERAPLPSPGAVMEAARRHLSNVRRMFEEADWLIFTLGLTEAWRSTTDGAVYPVAPGVAGGDFDPEKHEFVNFNVDDVRKDLGDFVRRIRTVNSHCKVLLTVSPVPLIATYENRSVIVSTIYSKSVLRVAVDDVERNIDGVVYFPSYEIITSPAADGRYFADDLREVNDLGVRHVMRVFQKSLLDARKSPDWVNAEALPGAGFMLESENRTIVCDEEVIEMSIRDT